MDQKLSHNIANTIGYFNIQLDRCKLELNKINDLLYIFWRSKYLARDEQIKFIESEIGRIFDELKSNIEKADKEFYKIMYEDKDFDYDTYK